ncbi:MAG TPA: site-specific integrase [Frankiaceae bacterium]|nr:site-specific integrase [Frankiaceae bacterium]
MRRTPSVTEAMNDYLALRSAQRKAVNTIANEKSLITRFSVHCGDIQVGNLRNLHVEGFFFHRDTGLIYTHRNAAMTGKEMAASSYNKCRSHMASFLKFCTSRGWVRLDLMSQITMMTPEQRDRLMLSRPELFVLIEMSGNPRDRAMLAVAVNLALRASEIIGIKITGVDLDGGWIKLWIPKVKRWDTMKIPPHLDRELRRWLAVYTTDAGLRPKDAFLFPAKGPNFWDTTGSGKSLPGPWKPTAPMTHPARVVQRALHHSGFEIEAGEGFHTIRRSTARLAFDHWAAEGYDSALRMTAALLHHKSVIQTERYIGLSPDIRRRDAEMTTCFLFDVPDNVTLLETREAD